MLPCKVYNAIRNEMSHANIFHEDGKEILDISSSPAIVDQQTHFNLTRIDPHNKMASSDSTSRESAHTKNAIPNELENNEESTQSNRSENMSCGANKRTSKNFPPVEPFHHAYHVGKVLGKGGFGVVYEGTRIRDGLQVALKHISKSKITEYGQVSNFFTQF